MLSNLQQNVVAGLALQECIQIRDSLIGLADSNQVVDRVPKLERSFRFLGEALGTWSLRLRWHGKPESGAGSQAGSGQRPRQGFQTVACSTHGSKLLLARVVEGKRSRSIPKPWQARGRARSVPEAAGRRRFHADAPVETRPQRPGLPRLVGACCSSRTSPCHRRPPRKQRAKRLG